MTKDEERVQRERRANAIEVLREFDHLSNEQLFARRYHVVAAARVGSGSGGQFERHLQKLDRAAFAGNARPHEFGKAFKNLVNELRNGSAESRPRAVSGTEESPQDHQQTSAPA